MKKKREKSEYVIGADNKMQEVKSEELKESNLSTKTLNTAPLNEKYPVENFIDFHTFQGNKKIKLQTYKYPNKAEKFNGVVYIL